MSTKKTFLLIKKKINTDFEETIIKFIRDWSEKIKKTLVYWDYFFGMCEEGVQVKYAISNAILGESLIIFLERIFDTKVFLSGPHYRNSDQTEMDFIQDMNSEGIILCQ